MKNPYLFLLLIMIFFITNNVFAENDRFYGTYTINFTDTYEYGCSKQGETLTQTFIFGSDAQKKLDDNYSYIPADRNSESYSYINSDGYTNNVTTMISGNTIIGRFEKSTGKIGIYMFNFTNNFNKVTLTGHEYGTVDCEMATTGTGSKNELNYYLPAFKPPPGNYSGLAMTNLNTSTQANVTIHIYNTSGTVISTEDITIPAGGQSSSIVGTSLSSEGWIKITSTEKLSGLNWLVQTGSASKSYMASVPYTKSLSNNLTIPHVDISESWDEIIYLSNPNTTVATVTLTYTNKEGVASTPYLSTIPANGSVEVAMSTIVGASTASGGSVAISSTQELAGFAGTFKVVFTLSTL